VYHLKKGCTEFESLKIKYWQLATTKELPLASSGKKQTQSNNRAPAKD
jgi:hypothetical protein